MQLKEMTSQRHFVVMFTILTVISPSMVSASKQLVTKACGDDAVIDRAFCLKALANAKATAAKDVPGLVDVAMKEAEAKAQRTLKVITEMMKKPSSPAMLEALKTCQKVYRYSINSFGMIAQELTEDAQSANYDVSLIAPEADMCVKALGAASVKAPQLVKGNRDLKSFSSLGHGLTAKMD